MRGWQAEKCRWGGTSKLRVGMTIWQNKWQSDIRTAWCSSMWRSSGSLYWRHGIYVLLLLGGMWQIWQYPTGFLNSVSTWYSSGITQKRSRVHELQYYWVISNNHINSEKTVGRLFWFQGLLDYERTCVVPALAITRDLREWVHTLHRFSS